MNMIPKNRHNKSNIKSFEKVTTPGFHFFNDAPNFALRVSKGGKKSYYASYSVVVGVNPDGTLKRQGKYKFICRVGVKPFEEVKKEIATNIGQWKKTPEAGAAEAPTVGTLVKQFMQPGAAVYRVKKKGGKKKYKQNTLDGYLTVLKTYVLEETNDPEIQDRLISNVKINGQYNSDRLKDIKLSKLTKDHIKNHHERLEATPRAADAALKYGVKVPEAMMPDPMVPDEFKPAPVTKLNTNYSRFTAPGITQKVYNYYDPIKADDGSIEVVPNRIITEPKFRNKVEEEIWRLKNKKI